MDDEKTPESPSYSAEDQKRIREGLRVLARVAVRTYLQKQGSKSQPSEAPRSREEDQT